jgi:hypothetical protein
MNLERLKTLLNPQPSVIEVINQFLKQEAANKPKSAKQGHRPSSLGSPCLRKIYYSYFRVEEEPISPETAKIFKMGIYVEKMMMEFLKGVKLHIPFREKSGSIPTEDGEPDPQFRVGSPRWRIRMGKIDNVAHFNEKLWIFEIKSKKSTTFNKMKTPDEEHIVQVALYFQMFNDYYLAGNFAHIPEITGKAEGARLVYVNKDTAELKEFVLDKTVLHAAVYEIDKKVTLVNSFADKKVLPPKTAHFCQNCPFKAKCDKNANVI